MKIKFIENHQLPQSKGYLFSNKELSELIVGHEKIGFFNSNRTFSFDSSFNSKRPKLKGTVIISLSLSKTQGTVFVHQYGYSLENLQKLGDFKIKETLIPKMNEWLNKSKNEQKQIEKHRMLLIEIDDKSEKFNEHALEWV